MPSEQDNTDRSTNSVISKWCTEGADNNCDETLYPFRLRVANQTHRDPGLFIAYRQQVGRGGQCNKDSEVDTAPMRYDDNEYHHFVFMRKGSLLYIYVDGQKIGEAIDNTQSNCSIKNDSPIYLGAKKELGDDILYFKGWMDDLRFYERALTEEEIGWLAE